MNIVELGIPGPLLIEPVVFRDERGFFFESWNAKSLADAGIDVDFVQDNHSQSARDVLRGLHFQWPNPQGKLVRVTAGAAWDVVVDIRRASPMFGKWIGIELSAANHRVLWVPPGFAHGFLSLAEGTDFLYKCTSFYDPSAEHTLRWNDPAVAIDWPLSNRQPIVSAKDNRGLSLAQLPDVR